MRVASLQLGVGAFCAALGALMLVAPHQFAAPPYALLQPLLPLWGVLFITAGASLVGVVVLDANRRLSLATHAVAAAMLVSLAISLAAAFLLSGLALYVPLAVGTVLAPWLARRLRASPSRRRRPAERCPRRRRDL